MVKSKHCYSDLFWLVHKACFAEAGGLVRGGGVFTYIYPLSHFSKVFTPTLLYGRFYKMIPQVRKVAEDLVVLKRELEALKKELKARLSKLEVKRGGYAKAG